MWSTVVERLWPGRGERVDSRWITIAPMRPRVLLAEDETAVADTIVYALRTDGCDVEWVTTGAEALQALDRGGVSLMVLDVGLPDVNGFDLCRQIRRQHTLPIVFLTARGEETDRIVGLE